MNKFGQGAPPRVPQSQPTLGNLQDWASGMVQWCSQLVGKLQSLSVSTSDIPAFQDTVSPPNALSYLQVASNGQMLQARTPAQVLADIGGAALAGSASQNFSVADATTAHQAVAYEQVVSNAPISAANSTVGTSASATTGTYTAPSTGALFIIGTSQAAAANFNSVTVSTSLAGYVDMSGGFTVGTTVARIGYLPMTAAQTTTITIAAAMSAGTSVGVQVAAFFLPLA